MSSTGADPRHRIARLRLRNQRLAGPLTGASALRTAADVVAWMGAVQAQEYPYARWSVGQRANGVLDEAAVEAALAGELAERGVMADGLRLGYILMHAELEEVICSGARQGKQNTYALFDDRVPPAASFDRDAALAEAVRRFFTSHGPATVKDFTWWSYLTVADTRRGLDLAGEALESTVIDGRTYWSAAGDPGTGSRRAAPRAHLLQVYDEYVVAYRESRDLLDLDHLAARLPGGQVMFLHAVILDGQFIGGWRRQVTKTALVVETQLARPLSDAEATAVEEAVARHGAFIGLPADWVRTDT